MGNTGSAGKHQRLPAAGSASPNTSDSASSIGKAAGAASADGGSNGQTHTQAQQQGKQQRLQQQLEDAAVVRQGTDALHAALQAANSELKAASRASSGSSSFASCYALGPLLGSGCFARVHQATRRRDGLVVAVKVLVKETARRAARQQLQSVAHEIAIMRLLADHPNAIQLLEVLQDSRAFYLVLEHCAGGELFDHVFKAEVPLQERDAACIIRQLASFLAHAHAKQIMHRDIKPENMLLLVPPTQQQQQPAAPTAEQPAQQQPQQQQPRADQQQQQQQAAPPSSTWQLKIVDYGGAVLSSRGAELHHAFGTVYYVAPEVLQHHYDARADLWSVGCVLHLLLTQSLPFEGANQHETLMLVVAGEPEFPADDWEHISLEAKALVQALLSVKPEGRPTAAELLQHPWVQQRADGGSSSVTGPGTPLGSGAS